MLIPGISIVRPQNLKPNELRLLPIPDKPEEVNRPSPLIRWIINIGLIGASVFTGGATGAAALALDVGLAATDIALNSRLDYLETGKVDPLSIALPLVGGLLPAVSSLQTFIKSKQAAKYVKGLEKQISLTGKAKIQMLEGFENVLTKKLGAKTISENLLRAGVNEKEMLANLTLMKNYMEDSKIATSSFGREVDFLNNDQEIFRTLTSPLEKMGLNFTDLFKPLESVGVNVVEIKTTNNLAKLIRSDKVIYEAVAENKALLKALEYSSNQTLSPTLWTRLMNARKIENGTRRFNDMLSLINPSTVVSKILDKTLGKVHEKIIEKIWMPSKEKISNILKKLIKKDIQHQRVKGNGVYPCFKSSWINYLRAVKFGPDKYKVFVIFRKWGYQPVLISELLPLEFITRWADSESPGRIYHEFRKKYGMPKGEYISLSKLDSGLASAFNMLGFIPDKYISLGVSLISNVQSGINILQQGTWFDVLDKPGKYIKDPLIGKFEEAMGGQFGVAMSQQISGKSPTAMKDYFKGKIQEHVESRESAYRKTRKETQGSLDSVRSLTGIIK